ncbi:proline-rich transmembrane protein 2-like [Alligator sinensis]|uniref:Proline-rich transmembrane protein 2-like n=1 Tax=Alligator sinensis TaxID=38654 RepID=A0A3Q0G0H1_ALLSI|nr:proline-rich transmembrane protein 2-like [Alligator sinensis]
MPSTAALQDPGDCCLEDPTAHRADRPVAESGERETPGPRDKPPPVPREEPLPPPDSGAGTLSSAEQKPPGEEPVKLELQRTCPGGLEERGSLTPEPGPVQKGHSRPPKQRQSLEVSRAPGPFGGKHSWGRAQEEPGGL